MHPGFSPDGGNILAFDGDTAFRHPLSQVVNGLVIGDTYNVAFYQAAGLHMERRGATTEQWSVQFGNETQFSTLMHTPDQGGVGWMAQSLSFTAQATTQTLTFIGVGTPDGLPPFVFMDGVSVEAAGAVPEPGSFALIGLGILALPVARRIHNRRKK